MTLHRKAALVEIATLIGSYRVIFDEDATTILVIYIGRRATTTYRRS